MKELCQSRYEQEAAEQEYQLLLQQMAYHNLPNKSFENSSLAQSLTILDSIQDINLRQQLFNQFKEVAVQGRAKILDLSMKSAKTQREEYKKKHENNIQKMFSNYRSTNNNNHDKNLSLIMLELIEQRCDKIGERIECMYKFKGQRIHEPLV